jgi:hypothetical protein
MSSKTYMKLLLASFLLGIGISMVGCGDSGGGQNAYEPAATNVALVAITGETPNNCFSGMITTALDGTRVCQVNLARERTLKTKWSGHLPRINPSSPSSLANPNPPPFGAPYIPYQDPVLVERVETFDKVTVTSVEGGWGNGRGFSFDHCNDIDVAGRNKSNDDVVLMNEGRPAGLYLATGSSAYPLFEPGVIHANEAGPLRFAFNAPSFTGNCYSLRVRFKIDRCLDVASLPHKCK